MAEKTDAELIAAARTDAAAFGEVYRRHAQTLHRWLERQTGDSRLALDLTAETFAQAIVGLRRFRDEADGSAGPWLYGIARNLLHRAREREHAETRARRRLGLPVDAAAEYDDADERASAQAVAPALRAAVASLSEPQRRALGLRVVAGLPYDEVASRLGTTETAARLRVMRALGTLSRILKGDGP